MNAEYIVLAPLLRFEQLILTGTASVSAETRGLSRFLAELSVDHPVCYAILAFFAVTIAALVLSLASENLTKLLGYKNEHTGKTHERRD
ncbi:MAG: hypothetical protein ACOC6C_03760 [Verrucomicrobiota bacterium]